MSTKDSASRRHWLKGTLGGLGAGAALATGLGRAAAAQAPSGGVEALPAAPPGSPASQASNEAYWSQIAALYRVSPDLVNLENGFYGVLPQPVLAAYHRHIDRLNESNSVYLRGQYGKDTEAIRLRLAAAIGARPGEIALTRGATEALQNLIGNYRGLKPGDTVLYSDVDYDSTQVQFDHLQQLRGVNVAKFKLPEPATHQGILDAYAQAFAAHPKARLLLITHVSHKNGLVLPVAEVIQLARARSIDVIVDAAHSWGQVDFKVGDLGADFIAFNLHKWIGAPLGVGFLYIRQERLGDIAPHLETAKAGQPDDIRSRVHTGTTNTANVLTIPDALDFHERIGIANKAARLRHLRDLWVQEARQIKGVQVITPDDPRLCAGITAVRLEGRTSQADNQGLVQRLRERHGIFTVARGGLASGYSVRVTPALFTRPADVERLAKALKAEALG
ncbi:MAG: aminotransferase class V-fold PLP-dependent enzyme [Rubrivivax sp.]|nr:MAG: aminotransferase class V-fold PLP-dependent enzyme [Rubrivivax sp.]